MATAYLAVQESLGREIVLKVLSRSRGKSTDFLNRFLNEGRIVASLRHPHIITIHDINLAGDVVYLAMEYLEGGDLKSRLGTAMSPELALDLAADIAQALAYAHRRNVVHRDVKPANILFRADGTLVLSDFGIAKQIVADAGLTSTGTILGSPYYMSPEQAEGLAVDGRTDIYSLGVIFHEMLTGERPYDADTPVKVLVKHIQEPVPTLPASMRNCQPLLNAMMAKKRDERIGDAGDLENELRALRESMLSASTMLAQARREGKAISVGRRLMWPVIGIGALGGALAAGSYFYAESLAQPSIIKPKAGIAAPPQTTTDATNAGQPAGTGNPASGAVGTDKVINALEWLARNSLHEKRLMHPPADNAYYYYSRLLALAPDNASANEVAARGFHAIAESFVTQAEFAYADRDFGKAQGYIALGLQVEPENEALLKLRELLERRDRSFLDSLLAFFRS